MLLVITQSGETADTLAALARSQAPRAIARWPSSTSSAAPSPANPTAASTCTPARKSASPPPRRSSRRLTILALLAVHLGRMRMLSAHRALEIHASALEAAPKQIEAVLAQTATRFEADRAEVRAGRRFLFPRPRLQVSRRARRRAQAEGNLLHPRRRLSRRRNEARPDRADRSEDADASSSCRRIRCTTRRWRTWR